MKRLLSCLAILPIFLVGSCSSDNTAQREPLPSPSISATKSANPKMRQEKSETITPQGIHILGVTAPITPVGLDGNELVPPSDPRVLGWWGKKAGSTHGTTLLVGHTVHTGGGTLDNLEDVPVGDILVIQGWGQKPGSSKDYQKLRYKVVYNQIISKETLAQRSQQLFTQTGAPKLVVVTCEDYNWSTGEYASNVVLMAIPI